MSYYGNNQGYGGGQSNYTGGGQQQQQQPNDQHTFQSGYGDPNSWQQQQYDQQQQQPQQQQQYGQQPGQQQQPQQQAFWNPAAAASMAAMAASTFTGAAAGSSNEQMLDFAGQAAGSFLQSSTARMIPGLERSMMALRQYFAVDNRYVVQKIKRVLAPFLSKGWKRQEKEFAPSSNDGTIPPIQYQLPVHDECAPDLYLPIMSLVTYVLLSALLYGTAGQFNPEVIPGITTSCFVAQILEVLCIRFGFYMLQVPVATLDLFCYTGYKYVGLCVNMIVGLVVGHFGMGSRGFYVAFLWTASCMSYFMLKTMANNIPEYTSAQGPKREVMVIGFSASQLLTMWFVSQTKLL